MGIEYYIVKVDKDEYFELGKGFCFSIMPYDKIFIVHNLYDTPSVLSTAWNEANKEVWSEFKFPYLGNLASEIFLWSGDDRVIFVNDNTHFDKPGK